MMKKILLSVLFFQSLFTAVAQNTDKSFAINLVKQNREAIGISDADLTNVLVSNAYFNKMSGTDLVYLQQSHLGVPVYNQLVTFAFKNGKLVSKSGFIIESIEKKILQNSATPSITATTAAITAMQAKGVFSKESIKEIYPGAKKIDFGKLDVTREKLTAELMWVPVKEDGAILLAWQINLSPVSSSDNWLIRIDANTNTVISETNLTVYCNFDHGDQQASPKALPAGNLFTPGQKGFSPAIVNGATYRVVPYPAESPIHTGGTPDIRANPWLMTPGNATSLKWHSDGSADYNYTRGNNVWAYHDRLSNNSPNISRSAASTTAADPLLFDFIPDFTAIPTQTSPVENQQFNITNLFYWNNIIHDLSYQYGFDEASGNFQANNEGRGGVGNDYVRAEAQDGGGSNNANFNTPADGGNGVMQMYLWNGSPQKDGDVDNGIIIHEFSHGISSRLTGGPSQSGCLSNNEQMGEGWSDYFALMATHDWAAATAADGFNNPRGIGTYASGQLTTGPGIRPRRYTTIMAVNEMTYANLPLLAVPHGVGFVWCTMLWDMTWEIIQTAGINPNLLNPAGTGGNTIALKLVTEAMKLQPCSPGFIDGRNAILMADQLLYGGQYRCAIIRAFARRGLGFDASQGSSNSKNDGTAGFSAVESTLSLSQNITAQQQGMNVTYTNTVTAGPCAGIANYLLTDTLPVNVTYISGGSFNPANRVVSFVVNIAAGQTQDYPFTVQINNGSWFAAVNLFEDAVTSTVIPAAWTTSSTTSTNWVATSTRSHSAPRAYYSFNLATLSDQRLTLSNAITLGSTPPPLTFWHWFNTESNYDGGILESSIDGGTTWSDMRTHIMAGNYTGSMATNSNSPIGGRPAWTGNSNGFMKTEVNLDAFANQNIMIRFRSTTDDGTNSEGWYVDDIAINKIPTVQIRSGLFNNAGLRLHVRDTFTVILNVPVCAAALVTSAPTDAIACEGGSASYTVIASGSANSYQWQLSSDAGISYTDIAGATASTLNVAGVTTSLNNNLYRAVVTNSCPSMATSAAALLTISNSAVISQQPSNKTVCLNGNTSFTALALGSSVSNQWQVSTDGGLNFTDIPGATASTLNLNAVAAGMNNNQYRMVARSCGPNPTSSASAVLSVTQPANISSQPVNLTLCPGENAVFSAGVSGTNITYQWQVSTNGGISYLNLLQANLPSLNLGAVTQNMNGNRYRVIINAACTANLSSDEVTLVVNAPVSITSSPSNTAACAGSPASYSVTAMGSSLSYQWQESVSGGSFTDLSNVGNYQGVTSPVLTISAVQGSMNGNAYRVIVTGAPCGSVNSSSAGLIVHPLPSVVINAANYQNITPGLNTTISGTPTPVATYTYEWFRNNIVLPGVTSSTIPVYIDGIGEYQVLVTDGNGCSARSNIISIRDSSSNELFIYPNPSSGRFQVRYYLSGGNTASARTIVVYDSKGSRVFSQQFPALGGYTRMDVGLSNMQSGIYFVELRDATGKRLGLGKLLLR